MRGTCRPFLVSGGDVTQNEPARSEATDLVKSLLKALAAIALCYLGFILVFYVTVGVHAACSCASTPSPYNGGPTPTPLPVSPDQAAAAARPFTGVAVAANYWSATPENPVYQLSGGETHAFVDGRTGRVLEFFAVDRMPTSDAATITAPMAQAAATEYLVAAGAKVVGMGTVMLQHRASIAFYDVTWPAMGDYGTPEVLVNSATGSVFAFDDLTFAPEFKLKSPVISSAVAVKLAQGSGYAGGETANYGPELQPDLSSPSWMVGFDDGVLGVDAVTGEVSVMKWSSSR